MPSILGEAPALELPTIPMAIPMAIPMLIPHIPLVIPIALPMVLLIGRPPVGEAPATD